ncbi:hypothetical protein JX265_004569, partial [Neoarthrinium moseri]
FPDGGVDAWLVVLGGWCALFCSYGLLNCAGVFLECYLEQPLSNYDSATVSWITSVQIFVLTGGNAIWGRIYDNHGPCSLGHSRLRLRHDDRPLVLSSMPRCSIGGWFLKRRALALGIVASGSSTGGVVLPILMDQLIPKIGFPWIMLFVGFVILALCGVACVTGRTRLPPHPNRVSIREYFIPLKEPVFLFSITAGFLFFWGTFLPFNYIILQAESVGLDPSLPQYLLPILNAVSLFGRILPGYAADKLGRFNTMICITLVSGVISLVLWIPGKSTAGIIAYGSIFGFSSSASVSLAPECIAQITPDMRKIGTWTRTAFAAQSIGALIGSPIGGALVQRLDGDYLGMQLFCGLTMTLSVVFYVAARTVRVGLKFTKI